MRTRPTQFAGETGSRASQLHAPVQAVKQLATELALERTHMAADRRLRDVQLTRGSREAQQPASRLEGTQRE